MQVTECLNAEKFRAMQYLHLGTVSKLLEVLLSIYHQRFQILSSFPNWLPLQGLVIYAFVLPIYREFLEISWMRSHQGKRPSTKAHVT